MKVLKSIKRGFALICVMALALSLCACSGKAAKVEPQGKSYFSYFDTVSFVYSYAGDSAEQFNDRSAEVSGILGEYHRLFDIYHEYSGVNNLCTVNRLAGGEAVKVDKKLIDFMLYAKELCEATNGEMDVTMGAVLSLWHDCREAASNDPASAKVPTLEELEAAAEHTGFGLLEIDAENCTLRLTDPEASLDVGALGKGYATERAAEYLESVGAESYVLNIGGNIRIIGTKPDGSQWSGGVENPWNASDVYTASSSYVSGVNMSDMALVTSGNYQRYYVVDGVRYHHLIDPDTLWPARYFDSVSVLSPDSGAADCLTTGLFCMSLEDGQKLIESLDGVEALWCTPDGEVIQSSGWADHEKK